MKISAICLSAAFFSVVVSSVAGGGCATSADSDRDKCLCLCLRSGYDCKTGDSLFADGEVTDTELQKLCESGSLKKGAVNIRTKGGPCYWDATASRSENTFCESCANTKECGGGVDKEEKPGPGDCTAAGCDGATSRRDCNKKGECCSWDRNTGTCGGENV